MGAHALFVLKSLQVVVFVFQLIAVFLLGLLLLLGRLSFLYWLSFLGRLLQLCRLPLRCLRRLYRIFVFGQDVVLIRLRLLLHRGSGLGLGGSNGSHLFGLLGVGCRFL